MGSTARVSKLAELRAKTDRELVRIIDRQLEFALQFARDVDARKPASDPDAVERFRVQAEEMYTEALRLLTRVEDPHSKQQLETKGHWVGQRLNVPAMARRSWASAYC